jgi:uncharacterized protein YaaN involved in tellurite resistance
MMAEATTQTALVPAAPVTKDVIVLSPDQESKALELQKQLNLGDSFSIISFGTDAQRDVTAVADQMLQGVKNRDSGAVGESLGKMMLQVRGLGLEHLDPKAKNGWVSRMLGRLTPVAEFIQKFEDVSGQVDKVVDKLETDKVQLIRDLTMLDKLYDTTLASYRNLELYIFAAQNAMRELDETILPAKQAEAEASGDIAKSQEFRDLVTHRNDLERKVHDLLLTRQLTMTSLPQIRQIQDTDKALVTKIISSVINTIPLWKQQIALAISMYNLENSTKGLTMVSSGTSEMIKKNADALRVGNAEARKVIEAGLFDIESVRHATDQLIGTLEDSIQIAEDGKKRRIAEQGALLECETKLKNTLRTLGTTNK